MVTLLDSVKRISERQDTLRFRKEDLFSWLCDIEATCNDDANKLVARCLNASSKYVFEVSCIHLYYCLKGLSDDNS